MPSPQEMYDRACNLVSDINEHVPTLMEYASRCQHVTEFGTRFGVSTVALLSGCLKVISYDLFRTSFVDTIQEVFPSHVFIRGDTLKVDIEPTELLFIDTLHTAPQLYSELTRHHHAVSKYIICHDTVTFGEYGEGAGHGLRFALQSFLSAHPEWKVAVEYFNNNGLLILEKVAYQTTLPDAYQPVSKRGM